MVLPNSDAARLFTGGQDHELKGRGVVVDLRSLMSTSQLIDAHKVNRIFGHLSVAQLA